MVSLLESEVRNRVRAAFAGRLLTGTLRRVASSSLNAYGDPVPGTASTWTFDGIVDSFSAFFAATAGIPATDVRVLIIAGSLATVPQQDDQVAFRGEWYQLRRLVERDPANATYIFSGFKIEDPT
jgi:hypothetical protein